MSDVPGSISAPPGREAEVVRLAAALDTLADRRGGCIVLSGEGGVGKTTLSAWLAQEAGSRGIPALDAPCFDLSVDTPYAPLVRAFGPVLRGERGVDAVALTAGLHSLTMLFDGIETGGVDPGLSLASDPLAPSRLHGALATMVSRLGSVTPAVIIVDDLHWADRASIEVIHGILADIPDVPILLVATVRPYETAARAETRSLLRSLRSHPSATVIDVGGIDLEATRRLVQRRLGNIFPSRVVDVVHSRSGGTPLVAEELIEVMIDTGMLRPIGRRWDLSLDGELPLPGVADDLIGSRLERLGADAVDVVATIAIAGEPIGTELLAAVVSRTTSELEPLLESLRRSGVVDRTDLETRTAWVVHHPIIGDVAINQVGAERRSAIHAAFVTELAADSDVDRRARHILGAGVLASDVELIEDLVAAGRSAIERGAPDEACRFLGAALAAVDESPGAVVADALTIAVTHELGRAWMRRGEFELASRHLNRAMELAHDLGDLETEATVLTELWFASWSGVREGRDVVGRANDLLAQLEEAGRWPAAHRLVRNTLMLRVRAGDDSSVNESLAILSRLDQRADDAEARWWSRYLRIIPRLLNMDDGPSLLAETESMLPEVSAYPDLHRRVLHERLDLTMVLGTREQIVAAVDDERAFAERHGDWLTWRVGLAMWDVAMGDGDLDRTAECEEVARSVAVNRPAGYIALARTVTDLVTGEAFRPYPSAVGPRPSADPVLEHLLVCADNWRFGHGSGTADAEAVRSARAAVEGWSRRPVMSGLPLAGAIAAGLACIRLGDDVGLAEVIARLERFDAGKGRATAWAHVLRAETSDGADRVDALTDAANRFDALGRPFDAAVCRVGAAEAGGRLETDQVEAARSVFHSAPWMASRLDAVAGEVSPSTSGRGRVDSLGLTAREREVADAVAEGLSNRDVANRLFISVRTVTSHLDHIYTKLGIGSRGELAELVAGAPEDT